jgi:hypothetical protein
MKRSATLCHVTSMHNENREMKFILKKTNRNFSPARYSTAGMPSFCSLLDALAMMVMWIASRF